MSSSLLRRSLELVEAQPTRKGKKKNKGVFDLIPNNHRSVKTLGRGGKIEKRTIYNISESSSKFNKKAKKSSNTLVEENIRKLQALTNKQAKPEVSDKIIKRARTGKPVIEIEEEKPDEKTAFTEEDFRKFEQEYFCS